MACADCGHGRFREEMGMQSCFGCMKTMTDRLQGWLWELRNRPPRVYIRRVTQRADVLRREADEMIEQLRTASGGAFVRLP